MTILNCPCCGHAARAFNENMLGFDGALLMERHGVSCDSSLMGHGQCGLVLCATFPTQELAIAAWNRRAPSPK